MRKLSLLIAIVLLSSLWVVAQNGPMSGSSGSSQASGSQTSSSGNETTVEGCLSGMTGNYTLTDSASGQTYQLQGDDSKLSKEVNHQVRIRGMLSGSSSANTPGAGGATPPGSSSTGTNPSTTSQAGAGSSGNTLQVTSVKKIADSCTQSPSDKSPSGQ